MNIVYKAPCELKPYDKNAKKHDDAQVANVAESIRKYGFVQPIVIDRNNVVVVGHCRLLASKKLKLRSVPCVCVDDLTDEQVKALRIVDNKTNESPWDFDFLAADLPDIDLGDFAFGFNADFSEPPALPEGKEPTADYEQKKREFEEKAAEELFNERMARGELSEEDEEYQEFVQKFQHKKTTDDCYTPPIVYEAIKDWCFEKYNLHGKKVVRPFYPGGDYQKEKYEDGCVVLDNPPFSILTDICTYYTERNIPFFLFAPTLTVFSTMSGKTKYVVCGCSVTYENGAVVNTSFVTNLGTDKITVAPDLRKIVDKANDENCQKEERDTAKAYYPNEVVSIASLLYMATHGVALTIQEEDVHFTRALDCQKEQGKAIFGAGFLLSHKAAAEKVAAEKEATEKAAAEKVEKTKTWTLSEREKTIIDSLGTHGGDCHE